jgi:predicted RNA binding protein YcfA (HicA-like mRNA interferase family)
VKVSQILRLLAEDGWTVKNQRGSHRQLVHPTKPGKVTVAGKPSTDIPKGTEGSILRQAGLKNRPGSADDEGQDEEVTP